MSEKPVVNFFLLTNRIRAIVQGKYVTLERVDMKDFASIVCQEAKKRFMQVEGYQAGDFVAGLIEGMDTDLGRIYREQIEEKDEKIAALEQMLLNMM